MSIQFDKKFLSAPGNILYYATCPDDALKFMNDYLYNLKDCFDNIIGINFTMKKQFAALKRWIPTDKIYGLPQPLTISLFDKVYDGAKFSTPQFDIEGQDQSPLFNFLQKHRRKGKPYKKTCIIVDRASGSGFSRFAETEDCMKNAKELNITFLHLNEGWTWYTNTSHLFDYVIFAKLGEYTSHELQKQYLPNDDSASFIKLCATIPANTNMIIDRVSNLGQLLIYSLDPKITPQQIDFELNKKIHKSM